jgi:16S rRNA (guanine(966)-N(2))-methyltransferase RsmD
MRITGGSLKGRLVECPQGIIRPAMDKMRESVFAIIQDRLPGAAFLDLFSGSGIIALEALSRGAASAVIVEKDKGKKRVLVENAALAAGRAAVHIMPVERYIKFAKAGPFDIIFLDPPFPYKFKAQLLSMIAAGGLLADGGLVIIHHPKEDKLPAAIAGLTQKDLRVYGRSLVAFYEKSGGNASIKE